MCLTIHALPRRTCRAEADPQRALFEAFYNYCFVPKRTNGIQLLTVRRDKQEREAFAVSRTENERLAEKTGGGLNGLRPLNATKGEL